MNKKVDVIAWLREHPEVWDKNDQEIAEVIGIPFGTVRGQIHAARTAGKLIRINRITFLDGEQKESKKKR